MIDIPSLADPLTDEEFLVLEDEFARLTRFKTPRFSPEQDRFMTVSNMVLYRWIKAQKR